MKRASSFQLFCLLSALLCTNAVAAMYELFDELPINGKLRTGAELVSGGQDDLGAMKITGNGSPAQYGYSYRFAVDPGESYGTSFAYRTTPKFTTMIIMLNYYDDKGKLDLSKAKQFRVPNSPHRWKHHQIRFEAPPDVKEGEIVIRFIHVPEGEYLLVDNLRFAALSTDKNFFNARKLDTIFDNWTFLGQQHFEHYILGSGARIVMDWKYAKAGESFLEICGDGSAMQYPLLIENLTVEPERNYRFSCWINATEHFNNGIRLFMFDCLDKDGKRLGQPRKSINATGGEWKELVFDFQTPPETCLLNIMFNLRHFPKEAVLRIDQLKFDEGTVGPEMRQSFDPGKRTMTIACPVLGDLANDKVQKTTYTIRDPQGKTIKVIEDITGEELTMGIDDYADGEYTIKADIALASGQSMATQPRAFGIYKDPYWKNDYGIIADIEAAPLPWCNLVRTGNSVKAWNGVYVFNPQLGIAQLTRNDGGEMLKEPVTISIDGSPLSATGPIVWKPGLARISAEVPVRGTAWHGKLLMTIDYMGFVRYTLEVQGENAFTAQSGNVRFVLEDVEFVHRADASWTRVGAVDLKKEKSWTTTHRYHEIMFGNIDCGLVWYAPRVYPEANDFERTATSANLEGEFKVELINAPLSLETGKSFKFEFALAAYPYRPSADNWKKLRFRGGKTYRNFDMMSGMQPMKYVGLPASRDDALTLSSIRALPRPGIMTVYQIPFYITDFMPEFRFFESEWTGYPARYYNLTCFKDEPNAKMRKCDPRARLWQDLYCHMTKDYLKKFPWDGFYFDCYGSDLQVRNGVCLHPTFEVRTFHERIYLTAKSVNPDFFSFTHLGAQQACTSVGFSDVVLMGEQYRGSLMQNSYLLEFLTLDEFRYENAVTLGADRMFLPQYRQANKIRSRELAAHNIGLAYAHNNMLYPSFINGDVINSCQERLFGFGLENAAFFPYWKPNPDGISVDGSGVVVSYWKNPAGMLFTVLNSTNEPRQAALKLPEKYSSATLYEPVADTEREFVAGSTFELAPYQMALVQLKF